MPRVSLSPGEVFASDYEVLDRIAEGGCGSVWRVQQRSTTKLRALKILHAEALLDADARRRFEAEAMVSSRIPSDHIVEVIQAGVEPDGTPWIVMELLQGATLAERVARQGPLDLAGVREIARQIGHALDAAHAVGIIHRDLKPENIFLAESRRADVTSTVKLLDFGIAKVKADARRTHATTAAIGTPLWMAPEQIEQQVFNQTDIWAFGLVVFYALTGTTYWESSQHFDFIDEIRQLRRDPCARALRRTGRALPPDFDAWFSHCVALDPRQRFRSAREAWEALAALRSPAEALAFAPTLWSMPPPAPQHVAPTQIAPPPALIPHSQSPQTLRPVVSESAEPAARRAPRWPWVVAAALVMTCVAGVALSPLTSRVREITTSVPSPAPPHEPRTVITAGCPEGMVRIAGSSVTLATHDVYAVSDFCIDRTETAVRAYKDCVRAGRCEAVLLQSHAGSLSNVCNATRPGYESHPINCVTVTEAQAYCAWRGARLPTSPEWELAAVGRSPGRSFPWGTHDGTGSALNACGIECAERTGIARSYDGTDPYVTTSAVGAIPAGISPEGVLDLAGNVSEWVAAGPWDGMDGRRTVRGGSWLDPPTRSHIAVRRIEPEYRGRSVGFRCASNAL
jgi:serine/threonine-protein kinase